MLFGMKPARKLLMKFLQIVWRKIVDIQVFFSLYTVWFYQTAVGLLNLLIPPPRFFWQQYLCFIFENLMWWFKFLMQPFNCQLPTRELAKCCTSFRSKVSLLSKTQRRFSKFWLYEALEPIQAAMVFGRIYTSKAVKWLNRKGFLSEYCSC